MDTRASPSLHSHYAMAKSTLAWLAGFVPTVFAFPLLILMGKSFVSGYLLLPRAIMFAHSLNGASTRLLSLDSKIARLNFSHTTVRMVENEALYVEFSE